MTKHMETELKLRCSDVNAWEKIMKAEALVNVEVPGSEVTQQLEARYFDTPGHALQKARLAYRLRREGDNWVATVKGGGSSHGGLHARMEWNVAVLDNEPDVGAFAHTEIGQKLQDVVGNERLEPVLITFFERKTVDVIMPDGSAIEVAADKGAIIAGEKTEPILEIELELKAGHPGALFMLGAALAREFSLLPEPDSKFYRGLLLAGLAVARKQNNLVPRVDTAKPVGEASSMLLINLIIQITVAQRRLLEEPQQPELVHELRSCLWRLRSVLEFFEPFNVIKQYADYQEQLKQVTQKLAKLRELDVAYGVWLQFQNSYTGKADSKAWLGDVLTETRNQEMENVMGELGAGLATPLLLSLWAELLDRDWQQFTAPLNTAGEYVHSGLAGWIKKMRKEAEPVDWMDTGRVHHLRMEIKKVRYIVEVMQPALSESSRLVEQLGKLQDTLGIITDAQSTEILLKSLLRRKSSKGMHLEAGMLIGWQMHEQLLLQKKLNKIWKKLNRIVKKWR